MVNKVQKLIISNIRNPEVFGDTKMKEDQIANLVCEDEKWDVQNNTVT